MEKHKNEIRQSCSIQSLYISYWQATRALCSGLQAFNLSAFVYLLIRMSDPGPFVATFFHLFPVYSILWDEPMFLLNAVSKIICVHYRTSHVPLMVVGHNPNAIFLTHSCVYWIKQCLSGPFRPPDNLSL